MVSRDSLGGKPIREIRRPNHVGFSGSDPVGGFCRWLRRDEIGQMAWREENRCQFIFSGEKRTDTNSAQGDTEVRDNAVSKKTGVKQENRCQFIFSRKPEENRCQFIFSGEKRTDTNSAQGDTEVRDNAVRTRMRTPKRKRRPQFEVMESRVVLSTGPAGAPLASTAWVGDTPAPPPPTPGGAGGEPDDGPLVL